MVLPRHLSSRLCIVTFGAALLFAGCRTYGGYGTEQQTLAQIGELNTRFSQALERARSDLTALQNAATARPQLEPFAVRFQVIVDRHAGLVEENTAEYNRLKGGRVFYRTVSSILGSTISEQSTVYNAYRSVVDDAAASLGIDLPETRPTSDYFKAPPYYERIRYAVVKPALDEVLRAAS